MYKHLELSNPDSCLNKSRDNEMIFVLTARDPAATSAIVHWCVQRIEQGKNKSGDPKIMEALECAAVMAQQRKEMPWGKPEHKGVINTVRVGQVYKNPYDGARGPSIRIVDVDGDEAVCVWRSGDNPKNKLNAFPKLISQIINDWTLVLDTLEG